MLRLLCILALAGCFCGAAAGSMLAGALHQHGARAQVAPVKITLGRRHHFDVGASGLIPGDSIQRAFVLKNVGSAGIQAISLTTVGAPSNPLDSDPVNGLQLRIDKCLSPWRKAWKKPTDPRLYTCKGLVVPVVAERPVLGSGIALANIAELAKPGQKVNLLLTLSLPQTATSAVMGQTSSITYTFTAA